jgi:hypothetical protein
MEFLKLQFLPLGNVKKLCSISYKVYHRREMEKNVFFFFLLIYRRKKNLPSSILPIKGRKIFAPET